jgi:hypothetical protein
MVDSEEAIRSAMTALAAARHWVDPTPRSGAAVGLSSDARREMRMGRVLGADD